MNNIADKIISNILGKPKKKKDSDMDGVSDDDDCQKYNTMRQDNLSQLGQARLQQMNRNISQPQQNVNREYEQMEKSRIRSKIY